MFVCEYVRAGVCACEFVLLGISLCFSLALALAQQAICLRYVYVYVCMHVWVGGCVSAHVGGWM